MVAPTFRTRGKIYNIPERPPGYPPSPAPVDPGSLDLPPRLMPPVQELQNTEDLGRHNTHLYSPLQHFYSGEHYNKDRSWDTGIQGVSMPDQIYMGRDIFAGQPERAKPYGGGAASASRTPMARSPGVGYPAAPYGGGVPPQPQIPRARPDATPAPGLMPMRPQMPGISPFGQPVAPMAPFHGLDRPPEVNAAPRQSDVLPQQETFRGIAPNRRPSYAAPPPELMRMLQMLNGSFGGGY